MLLEKNIILSVQKAEAGKTLKDWLISKNKIPNSELADYAVGRQITMEEKKAMNQIPPVAPAYISRMLSNMVIIFMLYLQITMLCFAAGQTSQPGCP